MKLLAWIMEHEILFYIQQFIITATKILIKVHSEGLDYRFGILQDDLHIANSKCTMKIAQKGNCLWLLMLVLLCACDFRFFELILS